MACFKLHGNAPPARSQNLQILNSSRSTLAFSAAEDCCCSTSRIRGNSIGENSCPTPPLPLSCKQLKARPERRQHHSCSTLQGTLASSTVPARACAQASSSHQVSCGTPSLESKLWHLNSAVAVCLPLSCKQLRARGPCAKRFKRIPFLLL